METCAVCQTSPGHASWCPEVAAKPRRRPAPRNPFAPREVGPEQLAALERLRSATDSYETARQMARHLRAERDRAIHDATVAGCTQQAIGDAIEKIDGKGLKREQVRLIAKAVEEGNAGLNPKPRPRRRPRATV